MTAAGTRQGCAPLSRPCFCLTTSTSDGTASPRLTIQTLGCHAKFPPVMWLIDTTTKKLEYVNGPDGYRYAVLSHTWEANQEVTFQEYQAWDWGSPIVKSGYVKIEHVCALAKANFCADKTKSSELSEAINSMAPASARQESFFRIEARSRASPFESLFRRIECLGPLPDALRLWREGLLGRLEITALRAKTTHMMPSNPAS